METTLLYLLAGAAISGITESTKRYLPGINPLIIVGVLAVLGGGAYAFLLSQGLWEAVAKHSITVFGASITIYNVLKEATKTAP